MASIIALNVGIGLGLAALTFAMQKAAMASLTYRPITVVKGDYRVVFTQKGWSFVAASIEKKFKYYNRLGIWRTTYVHERRFGDFPWGYSMRRLHELSDCEIERLACDLLDGFMKEEEL